VLSAHHSKYHAKPVVTADGERFDSQREYARWRELDLLREAGRIHHLTRQQRYALHATGGQRVCWYTADFVYELDGEVIVEDTKGVRTPVYRLKAKWMFAEYGIKILET